MPKKDAIDSMFDFADKIVDGAATVLKDMPEPDGDDDYEPNPTGEKSGPKRVVDVEYRQQPLLKSGEGQMSKKQPREVTLRIKALAKRRGGVAIMCETPTHEIVVVNLEEKDWKTLCDNADWMRMVKE
jgi:hypothetical protein